MVTPSCPAIVTPQPARLLCPWDFPGKDAGSGLPFPSPGDLPNPGIEPASPALAGGFFTTEPPGKPRLKSLLWVFFTDDKTQERKLQKDSQTREVAAGYQFFCVFLFCGVFKVWTTLFF